MNTAFRTLTGYTDAEVTADWANTKHVILYGRNLFESLELKPIQALMDAKDKGARVTYIDIRSTVTASHADRFWMIRPGTDLALNYALIHVILKENLYDEEYVHRWVTGLTELRAFVEPYTPEWAEEETGIPAAGDRCLGAGSEQGQTAGHLPLRLPWRQPHERDLFPALPDHPERPHGKHRKQGRPHHQEGAQRRRVRKHSENCWTRKIFPKRKRSGSTGWADRKLPIADPAHGVASMLPFAILNEDPYPVKALITHRFDPMLSIPNYNQNKKAFDKLDFILTIDINFGETAWYSDVVLPESMYLERSDSIQMANGPKPTLYMRRQCVPPRYDTKPYWEIIRELAKRLDLGHFFPYETIEDIWNLQLKDMGIKIEDFNAKGFVSLSKNPILWDRKEGIKFKTPSGKIEFVSSLMEKNGFPSFAKYEPVAPPPEGEFRLTVGRNCGPHPRRHPEQSLSERAGA